jgi:RNA polymerase sigma factor (sigma-70 family)
MPHTPTLSEPRVRSTTGGLHAGALCSESLRHESDERLVALTRAGSERAFAEVARRYQRQLRAYCSRLVGIERAQDAVQQALLQAFLALRDGAPREIALRPWLYRIAHNCSIDLLRMGSWDYDELDLEFDGVPQPPALFEQKEELRGLVADMRRLPEAQRQALTLRELEGCSYEEISARLGHTGSGVRQLIFRARTTLRKGAAALLIPFGPVRDRLAGMGPAVDSHQAGMAAVPASSGGGMETVGAAALAVVAVLGGVAGGLRSAQHQRQPAGPREVHAVGSPAAPAGAVSRAAGPVVRVERDGRRHTAHRGAGISPPAPALPLASAPAPAGPPPPPAPAVAVPPVAPPADPPPAAGTPAPADGEGTVVGQQAYSAPPSESSPPDAPAPDSPQILPGAAPPPVTEPPADAPEAGPDPAPAVISRRPRRLRTSRARHKQHRRARAAVPRPR